MDKYYGKKSKDSGNIQNNLGARQGGFTSIGYGPIIRYCLSLREEKVEVLHCQVLNFKKELS
jgi:hypothetical protein